MKLGAVIEAAQGMAPNTFTELMLTEWVNTLEGKIQRDIFLMPFPAVKYDYMNDSDRELLIGTPNEDIYLLWLKSRIEFFRSDPSYNDSAAMFNSMWMSLAAWFFNTYDPAHTKMTRLGEVDYTAESGEEVTIYTLSRYSILTGLKCVIEEAFEGDEGTASSLTLSGDEPLMSDIDLNIGENYCSALIQGKATDIKATITKITTEDTDITAGRAIFYGMVLTVK